MTTMARLARLIVPNHAHIVTIRALDGITAFPDAQSKQAYIDLLNTYCEKHQCVLLAYAVLDSRASMVLVPSTDKGVGKVMQSVGRFYVQHYNQSHERVDTLWDGRYRCAPVGFLGAVHQAVYAVEQLPSEHGHNARDYLFSSYNQNALGRFDTWVLSDACIGDAWKDVTHHERYTEFCIRPQSFDASALLDTAYKGWVVGSEAYVQLVEKLSGRRSAPKAKGGDRRSAQYRVSKGLPAKPSILNKKKRVKAKTVKHEQSVKNTEFLSTVDVKSLATQFTPQTAVKDKVVKDEVTKTEDQLEQASANQAQSPLDDIVQSLASMEEKPKDGVGGASANTTLEPDEVDEPIQGSLF